MLSTLSVIRALSGLHVVSRLLAIVLILLEFHSISHIHAHP
jgi:hypothetical protein